MLLNTTFSEHRYDSPMPPFPGPGEPDAGVLAFPPKLVLDALGASTWQISQQTFGYRLRGTDTLDWGDQSIWIEIKWILSLLEGRPGTKFFETHVAQYGTLLDIIESQRLHRRASFLNYMRQVEMWAEAYDQETAVMPPEELETLYDDAFFEAMDFKKKLP